ncbi:MAG: hypothetical protein QY307_01845 [Acidimicrobiia bacterium]|nr:MAG: hypothetical protein QY307_01845 [Acidimicrobiia bacterium]
MKLPNPWFLIPVVVAAVTGGVIGFYVTDASCTAGCAPAAVSIGLVVALACAVGVGVVAVLAARSLGEWRNLADRELTVPVEGPPEERPPTC